MSRSASHTFNCVPRAELIFCGEGARSSERLLSMPFEARKTWYVSFELPKLDLRAATRRSPRQSKTFFTEDEAGAFASEKCKEGLIVSAGTLNPILPRRTITSDSIHLWIGDRSADQPCKLEPDETGC